MRGWPNTIGVPVKWAPSMALSDFFCDDDAGDPAVHLPIRCAFDMAAGWMQHSNFVAIPADGFGFELAKLPEKAPRVMALINAGIKRLEILDSAIGERGLLLNAG